MDVPVNFDDSSSNNIQQWSHQLRHFRPYLNIDNCRPDISSNFISGVVIGPTGVKVLWKFGDSRSNRSRCVRLPHFVKRTTTTTTPPDGPHDNRPLKNEDARTKQNMKAQAAILVYLHCCMNQPVAGRVISVTILSWAILGAQLKCLFGRRDFNSARFQAKRCGVVSGSSIFSGLLVELCSAPIFAFVHPTANRPACPIRMQWQYRSKRAAVTTMTGSVKNRDQRYSSWWSAVDDIIQIMIAMTIPSISEIKLQRTSGWEP